MTKTNAERCREYYRRNREKLLAQKRDAYHADPEKMRERLRADYAKHRDKRVQGARRYRAENSDEVNARAKDKYCANRVAINERRKRYRAKHYAKIYARIQKWREENPERDFLYHAKRLLTEQTGIPGDQIPWDIAEAKAMQLKIRRWAKAAKRGATA